MSYRDKDIKKGFENFPRKEILKSFFLFTNIHTQAAF